MNPLPLCALLLLFLAAAPGGADPLQTVAEQSRFTRTGRYDEAVRLCEGLEREFPTAVRCVTFGRSPEGRPLLSLVVSRSGALTAAEAHARALPVMVMQGGIHAGEIDGKDAGFMALRDALRKPAAGSPLQKAVVVLVPVFNVDGHERFGPNQRPNQNGPSEMGWRVTAANLNLNRDYAKADAPEMRAMLRLLQEWDPIIYADLHVTDGAQFQPDVAVLLEPRLAGPEGMRPLGKELQDGVLLDLANRGHKPMGFYPAFNTDDDPSSGFSVGVAPPRFSTTYWSLRNRYSVLVETHSWKDYGTRVKATAHAVESLIQRTSADGPRLMLEAAKADEADRGLGGTRVPLRWTHTDHVTTLDFPGYVYERSPSAISGVLAIKYDPSKPQVWKVPFFDTVQEAESVVAPRAGYVIPVAWAVPLQERLRAHGLTATVLAKPRKVTGQSFRVASRTFRAEPYEGRQTVEVKGFYEDVTVEVAAGSLFLPVGQRGGRLLCHLLEPTAPDSLMAWGFFNSVMENKEYMEPYVAEALAPRLLAEQPALRQEFEGKLAKDPAFAASPEQRLRFFYERHPSFDPHYNQFPVIRVDKVP